MAKPKGGLGRGLDSLSSHTLDDGGNDRLTTVPIGDSKLPGCSIRIGVEPSVK